MYILCGALRGAFPAEGVGAYCVAFFGGALFRLRLNTCCLRVYLTV